MPRRAHPDYYYEIRDAIIRHMGASFNLDNFKHLFPEVARKHDIIPYTDGYLAHRETIRRLTEDKMKKQFARTPKKQVSLV